MMFCEERFVPVCINNIHPNINYGNPIKLFAKLINTQSIHGEQLYTIISIRRHLKNTSKYHWVCIRIYRHALSRTLEIFASACSRAISFYSILLLLFVDARYAVYASQLCVLGISMLCCRNCLSDQTPRATQLYIYIYIDILYLRYYSVTYKNMQLVLLIIRQLKK